MSGALPDPAAPARTASAPSSLTGPLAGPLAGKRMLFAAPDDYPAFRVDLVELFSRHLVGRGLRIDWSLRPALDTEGGVETRGAERFYFARRSSRERFGGLRYLLRETRLRLGLARRILRGDYDLVQTRDLPLWGVVFGLAARVSGTPGVFWMSYPVLEARVRIALHNLVPMSWPKRAVRLAYALVASVLFYRVALPLADGVIVQSKRMRERVAARGVPLAKMTPVPMGVTMERFNAQRVAAAQDPRLEGRQSMLYMCADLFSVTAGLTFEALAELVARGHDAVLVIVGAVSEHQGETVRAELERLGVADRVIFTGRLPLEEALGWVKRADVCLSPFEMNAAQQVATPTKLVEYLAMGRPVVATVHYDQNEVLAQSGAGLITAFSGAAMADGVAQLFADPAAAEAMGAKGPGWIRANRDYAKLADVVEGVYARLLSAERAKAARGEAVPIGAPMDEVVKG